MGKFYEELADELILYVRQVAWLTAIPKQKLSKGPEQKLPARMEQYKAVNADPPLPPLSVRHLYDWLMEIGPTEPAGMGMAQISWGTIRSWRLETRQRLSPWEVRTLRRLSGAYLTELHAAEDPLRPAPWYKKPVPVDREAEERQLRSILG